MLTHAWDLPLAALIKKLQAAGSRYMIAIDWAKEHTTVAR